METIYRNVYGLIKWDFRYIEMSLIIGQVTEIKTWCMYYLL